MSASLAIVAAAPLVATGVSCWIMPCGPFWGLTCGQRMVYASLVPAHDVFDSFVGCEVYGMCRPCANNNARHASPQTQNPFASGHPISPLYNTIVDSGGRRVEDLHSSLRRTWWLGGRVDQGAGWRKPPRGRTNLDSVDGVHDCVLLLLRSESRITAGSSGRARTMRLYVRLCRRKHRRPCSGTG